MLNAVILGEPVSFFLFEMIAFGLFVVCLVHGLRHRTLPGVAVGLELSVFVVYGLAFESIAVAAGFYSYGPFLFRVWHAPLVIGVGWAVIGFAVMSFSDSLNLPQWAKPFLDALLALLVDLGMDVVAIRDVYSFGTSNFEGRVSGMWNWGIPLNADWFGVPYANFMAWWLVIFIMSACLRGGRYVYGWFGKKWLAWVYPVAALMVALGIFLFLLLTFTEAFTLTTLLLLVGLSSVVTAASLRGRQERLSWGTDWPVFLVPTVFHLFFLGLLLGRKLYVGSPGVFAVSVVAFFVNEAVLVAVTRLPFRAGSSLPQKS